MNSHRAEIKVSSVFRQSSDGYRQLEKEHFILPWQVQHDRRVDREYITCTPTKLTKCGVEGTVKYPSNQNRNAIKKTAENSQADQKRAR